MIIQCPKCKTCFEVSDDVMRGHKEMKFQCAECAYVWTENVSMAENDETNVKNGAVENKGSTVYEYKQENLNVENTVGDTDYHDVLEDVEQHRSEKLPSVLEEKEARDDFYKGGRGDMLSGNNNRGNFAMWLRIAMCVAAVFIVVLIGMVCYSYFIGGSNDTDGIFSMISGNKANKQKLYIEMTKPITLVREGTNEYLIIRGFIYNPTDVVMDVPKLVVVLENREGLILQEQEREVDVKRLAPLEKTNFMFKVFKNSPQLGYVKVDFVDVNKI